MQAASLDILMDFETNVAKACAAVFANAGFPVPEPPQDATLVLTPDYRFHFACNGVADNHRQMVNGFQVYDIFKGTLDVEIFTSRAENTATSLGLYRSRVRQVFNLFRGRFAQQNAVGVALCPYYLILDIWDRGNTPSVQTDQDFDVAAMHYEIKFQINPDAWPAPVNQQTLIQTQQLQS